MKQFTPFAIVSLTALFGYFAGKCGINASCFFSNYFHNITFSILEPLYIFSLFSLPAVLFLPVVKKQVFDTWLRFALVWVILSVMVIGSTATSTNAWISLVDFVREDTARIMGVLFSVLSLLLICWQSFASKKVQKANAR